MTTRFLFLTAICFFASIHISAQSEPNLPSNFYEANCVYSVESFALSIAEKYRSETTEVSTYYSAVVGDLDNDGYSEIVIPGGTHNRSEYIFIFNHKAKLLKTISLPPGVTMDTNHDSVILVDLDNDGFSEIIVTASNNTPTLLVYDYKGNLITSITQSTKFPKTVGVADFNNDNLPEIYVGHSIYGYYNKELKPLVLGGNTLEATVAQDINNDRIPELISVNSVSKVVINSLTDPTANSISTMVTCGSISTIGQQRERTFALADIDLNGTIDVVTVVPIVSTPRRIEVRVWCTNSGNLKYSLDIPMDPSTNSKTYSIRNSWPFIGDCDANGYPDIVFMGGINKEKNTSVYRLEYAYETPAVDKLTIRAQSADFNDFSSMSTSMAMFDFNNDGAQEIVYRDESALYIINGANLAINDSISNNHSGTGWEYPVIASLTPSGESSIIMCSGDKSKEWVSTGSLRIYGAEKGKTPWMPARKIWNQYSYYQNMINDDLTVIPNAAPLNYTMTSKVGGNKLQPFNGHMFQLGFINPKTLESVFPLADIVLDNIDFGYNRKDNKLLIDLELSNGGDATMDPSIPINIYKIIDGVPTLIFTYNIEEAFKKGTTKSLKLSIDNFEQYFPFDKLAIQIAEGKLDCNPLNNEASVDPSDLYNILYVKKGEQGTGKSWIDSLGELSDALQESKDRNAKYPNSIDQIWIAEGTYSDSFEMQEGVNIYGGFYGEETEIDQMRPLQYPVILDAQKSGRPLTQLQDYTIPTVWQGLTLVNGNTAENGGGALLKKGSTLSYSVIKNNTTTNTQGGGVYVQGAKIINCIIEQNKINSSTTAEGAGIYAVSSSQVTNNTIIKNEAHAKIFAKGSGIATYSSIICNNILFGNQKSINGTSFEPNNVYAEAGTVHYNFSSEDDSTDPLFMDYEQGNYNLSPISPALNNGNNACIAGWSVDIEGKDRIYKALTVDQGAFEYQGTKLALSAEGYFYVNKTKYGDGDNWQNATNELSDALIAAKVLNKQAPNTVKQIWVAKGTYKGVLEMVEGANVHGGFAGHETDFNQIDTVVNKTYIDAQQLGRVLTQTEDFDTPTEWAGLILQNGLVSEIDKDVYGGGAYLKKNGIVRYSTIKTSTAQTTISNNRVSAYGGGVYLEEGARLENSIIDGNLAKVNNRTTTIENGVSLGGGINNSKNRLSYLIVRNNKTENNGNTSGSGIYSTGDIINSVVNNNKGKSAIYISSNNVIVNNTIVSNEGMYTVEGQASSARIQNSIVYGNQASAGNFLQTTTEGNNNLIDTDPQFEENTFNLKKTSLGRTMGNASFFPTDLDKDLDGKFRIISLNDNTQIIDAGVYQTNIKIESAKEIDIVVDFGTNFGDIDLKAIVTALLEQGYSFAADVDWIEENYNKLQDGTYTLVGNISNFPQGVVNEDEVQATINIIVKKNHSAEVGSLVVYINDWLPHVDEDYIIDCGYDGTTIPVKLTLPYFASIGFEPALKYDQQGNDIALDVDISKPGRHDIKATITSQDGQSTVTYPISFVTKFPFWSIVEQNWNNTFVVNNNKDKNGGYKFVSYKWYKEGKEISTKQYYSAGNNRTDVLEEASKYYVEMTDVDGKEYITCTDSPVLMYSGINIYPNPVRVGQSISIEAPVDTTKGGKASIYSLSGTPVKEVTLSNQLTTIEAPSTTGMYVLKVVLYDGVTESVRLIVH